MPEVPNEYTSTNQHNQQPKLDNLNMMSMNIKNKSFENSFTSEPSFEKYSSKAQNNN
jgi:hypothetical protein